MSAIQDIAGARIIVSGSDEQKRLIESVVGRFDRTDIDDKLQNPAFGYRAVHVVVSLPLPFEIAS